jgi:hypothetical protein
MNVFPECEIQKCDIRNTIPIIPHVSQLYHMGRKESLRLARTRHRPLHSKYSSMGRLQVLAKLTANFIRVGLGRSNT